MANEVASEYFGRWINAEREAFELKNKLAKQQDIIVKVANGVTMIDHNAASAEIILLKKDSAKKQEQIEELEMSLETKNTNRAVEVEKLVTEVNGLKLELANERAKQQEMKEVPGSKDEGDSEDEYAAVSTPASSISEQEIVEQHGRSQHSEKEVAMVPLVIGFEHDELNTTSSDETSAVVVAKPPTVNEVFEAYAKELESLIGRKERSVSRKAEKAIETERRDICRKYQDLMNTALPAVMSTLDLSQGTDVLAQKLIEKIQWEIRALRAALRLHTIDQQEGELSFHLGDIEHRMLEAYQVEQYPILEPIIACFMEKLKAVLRA
ncbi:hypothetical protein LTR17_015726 [Elasticomyces elasticus]|nr:hypothetical protein LTR17_015726 [Elasticomyces elasticus]